MPDAVPQKGPTELLGIWINLLRERKHVPPVSVLIRQLTESPRPKLVEGRVEPGHLGGSSHGSRAVIEPGLVEDVVVDPLGLPESKREVKVGEAHGAGVVERLWYNHAQKRKRR